MIDRRRIVELDRQYRAGEITAEQMRDRQNALMPRCSICRVGDGLMRDAAGRYWCPACFAKDTPGHPLEGRRSTNEVQPC